MEEELDEDESGTSGESTESLKGLWGIGADETFRSSGFGLVRLGGCAERVDCVRTGICWVLARDWVMVFVEGVLDSGGATQCQYTADYELSRVWVDATYRVRWPPLP
jgi:hypothetical protein